MFQLKIKLGNAALAGADRGHELARLMRFVAHEVEKGRCASTIRDVNGNLVGGYEMPGLEDDESED